MYLMAFFGSKFLLMLSHYFVVTLVAHMFSWDHEKTPLLNMHPCCRLLLHSIFLDKEEENLLKILMQSDCLRKWVITMSHKASETLCYFKYSSLLCSYLRK